MDYFQTVEINEKQYTISVEYSGDNRLISINNRILSQDNKTYFKNLFYEVMIDNHKVTVRIHATGKQCSYEIFVDDLSLTSGKHINEEKENAYEEIKDGFFQVFKEKFCFYFEKKLQRVFHNNILWNRICSMAYMERKNIVYFNRAAFSVFDCSAFCLD